MIKRLFDIAFAGTLMIVAGPVTIVAAVLIAALDGGNPFYGARRVGRGGQLFTMWKLRTMVRDADKTGVTSTAADDPRITPIGHVLRRFKLDELPQLWNVVAGDMSIVGPRPNVPQEVALLSREERHSLDVRPGITDFASVVFADEAEILSGHADPDLAYNQLIRPGKSRLALLYVDRGSLLVDIGLILATALSLLSRNAALRLVSRMLATLGAPPDLVRLALRTDRLIPAAPPGSAQVVTSRRFEQEETA